MVGRGRLRYRLADLDRGGRPRQARRAKCRHSCVSATPTPVTAPRSTSSARSQEFIDAGVAGIHIEDQREPKKSGGTTGIELVSDAEAIGRLNAAVEARDRADADFVIVARTDGFGAAGGGVDEAIRRAQLYRAETGVDVIFYEGFHTVGAGRAGAERDTRIELRDRGTTHRARPLAELTAMGQAIEAVPFVLPGVHEVWRLLLDIKEAGDGTPFAAYVEKMSEAKGTAYEFGLGRSPRAALSRLRAEAQKKNTYRRTHSVTTSTPPMPSSRRSE